MNEYDAYQLIVNGVKPTENNVNKSKSTANKVLTKDEQIKTLRNKYNIKCHSKAYKVAEPIEQFTDLISRFNVKPAFLKCFETLKYLAPTPVQMQSIPVMLEGKNILTLAPTGSGKTAAFLIPLLHEIITNKISERIQCEPQAVVLSPTIELAKQIYQECICLVKELDNIDKPNIVFCCKEKKNSTHWKNMMKTADIIICTPIILNRLLIKKDGAVQVSMKNMKWLIIDECDKMFEESVNSFSSQFSAIQQECLKSDKCRFAMFSATHSEAVWQWTNENLADDIVSVKIGVKGAAVETIKQELRYCQNEQYKLIEIKTLLLAGKLKCPCLIFLDKADSAISLHKLLEDHGVRFQIKIETVSGLMTDGQRRDTITRFREGKIHFLICTNLLARGMDFKGVETVINYDLPKQKEEYIHRIGRCGRAGKSGSAITLWTDADIANGLVDVMKIMKASNQPFNEELMELAKKKMNGNKYKGNKMLKKLKQKYTTKDGKKKSMNPKDKKKKVYLEKCVVRTHYLKRSANSLRQTDE